MKRSFAGILAATALVATFAVSPAASAADVSITGRGASYPLAMVDACLTSTPGVTVTYKGDGSGNGRGDFRNGVVDFGASDAPYSATEAKPANFTYVPFIGGPIAVAYNIPGLKSLNLSPKSISGILKGTITTWNDKTIAADNKGVKLPSNAIVLVYRSGSSGTTENFSEYMKQTVPTAGWVRSGTFATASGNSKGTSASGGAGVITEIKKTSYSIGYADLSDAKAAGATTAKIKNGAGEYVAASVPAAKKFLAEQDMNSLGIVYFDYDASIKGAYNLSLVSYALAPTKAADPAKGAAVKAWFKNFVTTCAPQKAALKQYVALDGAFKTKALSLIEKIK